MNHRQSLENCFIYQQRTLLTFYQLELMHETNKRGSGRKSQNFNRHNPKLQNPEHAVGTVFRSTLTLDLAVYLHV